MSGQLDHQPLLEHVIRLRVGHGLLVESAGAKVLLQKPAGIVTGRHDGTAARQDGDLGFEEPINPDRNVISRLDEPDALFKVGERLACPNQNRLPVGVGLPFSAGTSSSSMWVIGGTTTRALTTASASRSSSSFDIPTWKFTPATPREASASVPATYHVLTAVPPGRTKDARGAAAGAPETGTAVSHRRRGAWCPSWRVHPRPADRCLGGAALRSAARPWSGSRHDRAAPRPHHTVECLDLGGYQPGQLVNVRACARAMTS